MMLLVCVHCETPKTINFSSVCDCGENSFLMQEVEIDKETKAKILNGYREEIIKQDTEFSHWFRDNMKDTILFKYHADVGDIDFLKRRFPDMSIETLFGFPITRKDFPTKEYEKMKFGDWSKWKGNKK